MFPSIVTEDFSIDQYIFNPSVCIDDRHFTEVIWSHLARLIWLIVPGCTLPPVSSFMHLKVYLFLRRSRIIAIISFESKQFRVKYALLAYKQRMKNMMPSYPSFFSPALDKTI